MDFSEVSIGGFPRLSESAEKKKKKGQFYDRILEIFMSAEFVQQLSKLVWEGGRPVRPALIATCQAE